LTFLRRHVRHEEMTLKRPPPGLLVDPGECDDPPTFVSTMLGYCV